MTRSLFRTRSFSMGPTPFRGWQNFLLLTCWLVLTTHGSSVRGQESAEIDDQRARDVAQQVFQEEDFWWKRTEEAETPSAISEVLRSLYQTFIEPVLDAIWEFVKEVLEWLLQALFGEQASGDWSGGIPLIRILILLLLILGVALLIVFLRKAPPRSVVEQTHPETVTLPRANLLLQQAESALSSGDRRSSLRFAFLSLIAWLQNEGRLRYDPSRSNREYQRDLRESPELVTSFRAVADPFEQVWFGGREVDASRVESVLDLCRRHVLNQERAS